MSRISNETKIKLTWKCQPWKLEALKEELLIFFLQVENKT